MPAPDLEGFVKALSVADLIEKRLSEDDPWRLALVQRHLVWDELRMAQLLDSLLAGYPIGSLLVCKVRGEARILREAGGTRVAELARAGTWQLLDGQQRVNALVTLFTELSRDSRFYLHMTRKRVIEEVITGRRARHRALDYLAWRPAGAADGPDGRDRYIELARLHAWAASRRDDIPRLVAELETTPGGVVGLLNEIDPVFADELPQSGELAVAADRLRRLLLAWVEPRVSVQHFTVDSPSDVLQVFTRINLEGVRLDGEDVFFAAVKTQWPNAEEHLDRVAAASPLLNRMTALRLLARLAARARSNEDLLPLRVDRLNGAKGHELVRCMERLASDGSPILKRIGVLGRVLTEGRLGHALRSVSDGLLDHVFGWAAVNEDAADPGVARRHVADVETYLVGAQAFRYATIFRDAFLRLGFAEAVAAGCQRRPFPTAAIIARVRSQWQSLRLGLNLVASVEDDDQRRAFLDQNVYLFLSILQRIPYLMPVRDGDTSRREVEWDHIYPQARANMMRVKHPDTGYLVHHRDRSLVWSTGNLWALDGLINNVASDRPPSKKLEMLEDPELAPSCWPTQVADALAEEERADLLQAERLLDDGDVESAMQHFRQYVVSRGLRLYRSVLQEMPGILDFAPHAEYVPGLHIEAESVDLWTHLGLDGEAESFELPAVEEAEPVAEEATAPAASTDKFGSVRWYAEQAGLQSELLDLIEVARELGLHARPNVASVMFTPPKNKNRMLFTVWPEEADGGRFSIYRWAAAMAEFFPGIDEQAARDALGPDGYGVLERQEVASLVARLRSLLASIVTVCQ